MTVPAPNSCGWSDPDCHARDCLVAGLDWKGRCAGGVMELNIE